MKVHIPQKGLQSFAILYFHNPLALALEKAFSTEKKAFKICIEVKINRLLYKCVISFLTNEKWFDQRNDISTLFVQYV